MGSESAARLGAAQDEHAKRRAFIVVDENMEHFREVLEAALSADYVPEDAVRWAKSALKTVNQ